ncbi:MAG: ABC transporter ATP-binding protein [Candidatus Zhuqueibacterota bacterium]
MIQTVNISKSFYDGTLGEIQAVKSTSLHIRKGEVFGLLGPNGAGKSTFLRMLATILTPSHGSAELNGYDVATQPEDVKKSIGFLSGNTRLYGKLSPRELLHYFGSLYEMNSETIETRTEEIFSLLNMHNFVDQRIEKLSTGQTQKTSIARSILHDPAIFILDEPTLGLDILTSRSILEFIRTASQVGKTVLFSTHYMEEAERLCHRIGFMHRGEMLSINTLPGYAEASGKTNLADIFMSYIDSYAEAHREI